AEAKKMAGKTAERIRVIRPVRDSVIANAEVSDEMLRSFIRRASGHYKIMKPRVLVAVPSGISEVGIRTVKESALSAGARAVRLVEEPFASALGAGMPVEEPDSNMIVDIGGGTTEVAVISLGQIVAGTSVAYGGDSMDEAIIAYIQREKQLLIGQPTAERIKIEIGSAYPMEKELVTEVKGLVMGPGDKLPKSVPVKSEEIRSALAGPVSNIVKAIRKTIDACPPEIAGRLVDNGLTLTGGGSLLRGLANVISEDTGLSAVLGHEPLRSVVNGTGILLQNASELFSQPQNSLIGHGGRE
ncbi:MAG: rod shape-determining protein MreB, partial [Lentisphaeria bacterium]|nr:rod shape-determining protein MreB [Lentisphaeria bacterium]